jgi:hypothetical protein
MQRELWFSDDYDDDPPDTDDPVEQQRFRDWYLKGILALDHVDSHIDHIDQIHHLKVLGIEEPFGDDGPFRVTLHVQTVNSGTKSGWLFIHRDTHTIFGASG